MNRYHFRSVIAIVLLYAGAYCLPSGSYAADCSEFPDGGTLTSVVNTYYTGVGTASAGATNISVASTGIRGSAARIAADDMLLVMQMQDADINSTNSNVYGDGIASNPANGQTSLNSAGHYEYVVAQGSVVGGNVSIIGAGTGNGLLHTYRTVASSSGTNPDTPRRSFQVILVPRYKTATLSSTLTAINWNGNNGGVLALDITGTLTLGGTVSVNGMGFRGGAGIGLSGETGTAYTDYCNRATRDAHGSKGEGIAGTPRYVFDGTALNNIDTAPTSGIGYPSLNTNNDASSARGAPGNAGGGGTDANPTANDENSGGGGGGNGGTGGYGGKSWDSNLSVGGHPGAFFPYVFPYATGTARIAMGGGGGAGSRNNSEDPQSAGGLGGGIVMIRATTITGTGTITANGRGNDITSIIPDNDGGGGGGAGGSIIVVTRNGSLTGLTAQANGGAGVNAWPMQAPGGFPGERHGPGGGGGGGVILLSSAAASTSVTGGAAGTTTTALDIYGATPGINGVVTTINFTDLPGVESCDSSTASRATIRGMRIDPTGLVEFITDLQQNTAAFQLWQTADPKNRESMELLTAEPVLSQCRYSMAPLIYKIRTLPITAPFIFIEEIESGGARNMLGPYPTTDEQFADECDAEEDRLFDSASLRSTSHEMVNPVPIKSTTGAEKIEVTTAGIVQLSGAELTAMGMPKDWLEKANLQKLKTKLKLTHLGQAVSYDFFPDQGDSGILEFRSTAFSTDYTNRSVYILSWQGNSANSSSQSQIEFTRSGFPETQGMVRIAQNNFYAPFVAADADPWIWTYIGAGEATTVDFDVPELAADTGRISIRIGFSGATNHVHSLSAVFNGQHVGEVTFQGVSIGEITGQVPAGTVLPFGNQLSIEYSIDPQASDSWGLAFLDMIDLGVSVVPNNANIDINRMSPYDTAIPSLSKTDYLIITNGLFAKGAKRIADQKSKEGYQPTIVDVERVYDRYSYGEVEARAIQNFVRDVWSTGKNRLKYLLLIGDDTFDPNNYMGLDQMSFLPSLTAMDQYDSRIPSENLYADMNDDGIPDIAIGRLPVSTAEQMDVVAGKIVDQNSLLAAGQGSQLFTVDNQGANDPSFIDMAEPIAASLPQGTTVTWADVGLGAAAARSTLLNGLKDGMEAVHYFGHGGYTIWSDDGLLSVSSLDELANSGAGSVIFTWTCNVQYFQYHLGPCINETLLLVPDGGAVATVGPVGVTTTDTQKKLYSQMYLNLSKGMTLGQAIQQAKATSLTSSELARPAVDGWTLLGDPSLRLNWGGTSQKRAAPNK